MTSNSKHKHPSRTSRLIGCIWCGKSPRSREHLWPEWYSLIVPKSKQKHENFRITTKFTKDKAYVHPTLKTRAGDPASLQLKVVCAQCNKDWMGKVEEKAKQIMTPLILGINKDLNVKDIKILKDWIALKTIVGEYDDPNAITIDKEALNSFYTERKLQGDWKIWIGRYFGGNWASRRKHHTFYAGEKITAPNLDTIKINTQSTTMVGGQLFMMTISTSSDALKEMDLMKDFGEFLFQIYPETSHKNIWPTKQFIGDEHAEFLSEILQNAIRQRDIN